MDRVHNVVVEDMLCKLEQMSLGNEARWLCVLQGELLQGLSEDARASLLWGVRLTADVLVLLSASRIVGDVIKEHLGQIWKDICQAVFLRTGVVPLNYFVSRLELLWLGLVHELVPHVSSLCATPPQTQESPVLFLHELIIQKSGIGSVATSVQQEMLEQMLKEVFEESLQTTLGVTLTPGEEGQRQGQTILIVSLLTNKTNTIHRNVQMIERVMADTGHEIPAHELLYLEQYKTLIKAIQDGLGGDGGGGGGGGG